MRLRYLLKAPTVGEMLIPLSLSTISIRICALADVVERLQGQAAHQGRVTDDDRDLLRGLLLIPGEREAGTDAEAGAGVAAVHHVVLGFAPAREAADAAELAEGTELVEPPRQQLVRVSLVAGVPDDAVRGAVEQPMERDRELDHAQRAAQMPAGGGDRLDDRRPQLRADTPQLLVAQRAQVGGAVERGKDRQAACAPGMVAGSGVAGPLVRGFPGS